MENPRVGLEKPIQASTGWIHRNHIMQWSTFTWGMIFPLTGGHAASCTLGAEATTFTPTPFEMLARWGTVRVSKPILEVGILYRGSFRDVFHAGLIHVPLVQISDIFLIKGR